MLEDGTLFRGFRKIEWHDLGRGKGRREQALSISPHLQTGCRARD
jgi:hypothetical protein